MPGHGTFGRFRPLARARPPSGGKISASAALSASARRTPPSARLDSARTRTHSPRMTAGWCARQRLRSVTVGAHPALRGSAQIDHEPVAARRGGQDVRDMLARVIGAIEP
jgi:hypothetical protein